MVRSTVEEYILRLPDDEKILIIHGYEEFSRVNFIGNEPIRLHAEALMAEMGTHAMVVHWMTQLAFEAYRYFGKLYIGI